MGALWRRCLLGFEIRKRLPSGLQSLFGVPLRSSDVPVEEDTVDLEHAVVWLVWSRQILPLLQRDGRFKAFGFRTEVDGGLIVTIHANDPRATQNASANVAPHVACIGGNS